VTKTKAPDATSLAEHILQAVERGELAMPPLPELATRLTELLGDDEGGEPRKVAELIQNEPAIAASILRMANSASFGGLQAVSDLSGAIARLGLKQVSILVTAVVHKGNFDSNDPDKQRFLHVLWDHAVATAIGARTIATLAGDDGSEPFLAGLLHDTGKLLVLRGHDYLQKKRLEPPITPAVLEDLMNVLHAQLGHHVLKAWNIPGPICRVAEHHHDDDCKTHDLLLLRVQAANAIARKLGAHLHPTPDLELLDVPAIEQLNLTDLELATLMVDVEDEFERVRKLF
jgi:HD-like signal output (HDOD) protein